MNLSDEQLLEFHEFWQDILWDEDGNFSTDKAILELYDYQYLLDQVPQVYWHITNGNLSKPNYFASTVIAHADAVTEDLIREAVQDALLRVKNGESPDSLLEEL